MRSLLIAGTAIAALFAGSIAASAQGTSMTPNERYCSQSAEGGQTSGLHCAFRTMAQCKETVKNGKGTCVENPKLKKM